MIQMQNNSQEIVEEKYGIEHDEMCAIRDYFQIDENTAVLLMLFLKLKNMGVLKNE